MHEFQCTGISFFNAKIFSEEDFLASFVTDCPLINEEDFSVPSTSCSSYTVTLMDTLVETEQPSNSPLTLICPYLKAFTGKLDVKRKRKTRSCCVQSNSPEKQELQQEEGIGKAFRKQPKKKEKRLVF